MSSCFRSEYSLSKRPDLLETLIGVQLSNAPLSFLFATAMSDELLSPELRKHVQRSRVMMFARFATQKNVPQSGGSSCVSILSMRHCSGNTLPLILPLICCVDAPTNSKDAEFATQLVNDENESFACV